MVIFSERPYVLAASSPFRPTISYCACLAVIDAGPASAASTKTRASLGTTFVTQARMTPAALYVIFWVRLALGTVTSNRLTYSTPEGERKRVPFFRRIALSGFSFLT